MWDKVTYRGLWRTCCPDNVQSSGYKCVPVWYDYYALDNNLPPCTWVWSGTFSSTNKLPDWYKASEVLYCFAICFLFVSILLQIIHNILKNKNTNCFPAAVVATAFAGAISATISLAIYGGSSYKDGIFAPLLAGGRGGQLEWAFYIGAASAGICFCAAVLLFIDLRIQKKSYTGYKSYKSPVMGTRST